MYILQINASYKPAYIYGGPTMSVARLCESLIKEDINVAVLTTNANGDVDFDYPPGKTKFIDGVPVKFFRRLTKDHSHFSPSLLIHLYNLLKKQKKDSAAATVIHIHAWWNLVSILCCAIAVKKNMIVIISPRGTLSPYTFRNNKVSLKKWVHQLWTKQLLNRCHFHVTSKQENQEISALFSPLSITEIPNLIEFPEYPPTVSDRNTDIFQLLFISRIDPKKGLDILLKALAKLPSSFTLNIAGTGHPEYIDYLKTLSQELKISERINWLGHMDSNAKFELLAHQDLMVLPSNNENFANVVIESLSVGTPVLISKTTGLADYIQTTKLGWIEENNPENFAQIILKIKDQPEELSRIRSEAPAQIRIDFASKVLTERYINLYKAAAHG